MEYTYVDNYTRRRWLCWYIVILETTYLIWTKIQNVYHKLFNCLPTLILIQNICIYICIHTYVRTLQIKVMITLEAIYHHFWCILTSTQFTDHTHVSSSITLTVSAWLVRSQKQSSTTPPTQCWPNMHVAIPTLPEKFYYKCNMYRTPTSGCTLVTLCYFITATSIYNYNFPYCSGIHKWSLAVFYQPTM